MSTSKLKPIGYVTHNFSDTNVTTSAWAQIKANIIATLYSEQITVVEIYNGSDSILKVSVGPSGAEAGGELDFVVIPGGNGKLPVDIANNARLAMKAVNENATTGYLAINCFGD